MQKCSLLNIYCNTDTKLKMTVWKVTCTEQFAEIVSVLTRFQWSRRKVCCLDLLTCFSHFCYSEQRPSLFSGDLWVKLRGNLSSITFTDHWGHVYSMVTITPPALLQVVLDCPLDTCFTYIYQYEPYLKDPVGFPRIMVSLEKKYTDTHLIKTNIFLTENWSFLYHYCRCWCICSMLCPC